MTEPEKQYKYEIKTDRAIDLLYEVYKAFRQANPKTKFSIKSEFKDGSKITVQMSEIKELKKAKSVKS